LRGPIDATTVGRIVLGVGVFPLRGGDDPAGTCIPRRGSSPCPTTHHDSVLFATCVGDPPGDDAGAADQAQPEDLRAALAHLPGGNMVANNRRLAWTELTMVVIFFFLMHSV